MRTLRTLWRATCLPAAVVALLLAALPAAGDEAEKTPPAATVELNCADQETRADQAVAEDSAPAAGVGRWFLNDWSQGPPSVFILNPAHHGDSTLPYGPWRGDEGCLLLTIKANEDGEACDFVLGETAHQFTTGCACASSCRCPHCGSVTTTNRGPDHESEACPPLQAGEPAKVILDLREQLNPQFGLPNWEVDFLPGTAAPREDGREVMIQVIRRREAEGRDPYADECESSRPAAGTCPAVAAGAPVHPHPHAYEEVVWGPPAPPMEFHPEQQVIHMLRESSHQLDCTAHLLESQGQYERADQLRETAAQLRAQAREAQHALHHSTPPQPAEYSEAGLRQEIRQLREELRRHRPSHEAHYRPSGMER